MTNSIPLMNAEQLLDKLSGDFDINREAFTTFVADEQRVSTTPIYITIFSFIGAFFAAIFFIGFLFALEIINFNNETVMIIAGVIFVISAFGLWKVQGTKNETASSFLTQLSMVFMGAGKVLIFGGIGIGAESQWITSFTMLLVTLITYPIYNVDIDRFLSSLAVLIFSLACIFSDETLMYKQLLFNGFILAQLVGAGFLFTSGRIKSDYYPLAYALIFSLCICAYYLQTQRIYQILLDGNYFTPYYISIMFTVALVSLLAWVAGGWAKLKTEPLIIASLGIVLLGFNSTPAILLSIGILILGYAKHDRILTSIGVLFLPFSLFNYYQSLHISLLDKSGILIISGAVLLAGCFYLHFRGLNREEGACEQK